jgi:hypothetical protein
MNGHVTEWNLQTMLAALGIAAKQVTGREFIAAYLIRSETSVRLSAAGNLCANAATGVPGELHGSWASASSVSRLLRLTVDDHQRL